MIDSETPSKDHEGYGRIKAQSKRNKRCIQSALLSAMTSSSVPARLLEYEKSRYRCTWIFEGTSTSHCRFQLLSCHCIRTEQKLTSLS